MCITCNYELFFKLTWIETDMCFSHDGVLTYLGHRHDWEGITVVWRRDEEGDWWHRAVRRFVLKFRSTTNNICRVPYTMCTVTTSGTTGHHFEQSTCMMLLGFEYCLRLLTPECSDTPNGLDVRDDKPGTNKKHPKVISLYSSLKKNMLMQRKQVYVGFFSHGAYHKKDDRSRSTAFNAGKHLANAKKLLMKEYRYATNSRFLILFV